VSAVDDVLAELVAVEALVAERGQGELAPDTVVLGTVVRARSVDIDQVAALEGRLGWVQASKEGGPSRRATAKSGA